MYVHPDNPISNLSLDEAREVFAGNITRWSELKTEAGKPGPAYSIQPIGRLHCKNRPGHWRLLLDNEDLFSPRLIEVGTIEDVFRQVEGNPYSIGGFESLYMAGEVYPAGKHLKTVKINGYAPTPGNLLSGNYPLYFVFNITTWKKTGSQKAMDADLIAYLQQKISEVDAKFGMVPSDKLRQAGWQFSGDELVGAPLPVKGER
jgi:ABC-type phosphate transport system substrate-binding protein